MAPKRQLGCLLPRLLARAHQRLALSAYREAEADFRALLGAPEAAEARLGLARILVTTGRYAEAKSTLTPLLADSRWDASAALWTARAQEYEGDVAGAEATLRGVPPDQGSNAVQLELGTVLLREGRRADAEPVLMTLVNDLQRRSHQGDGWHGGARMVEPRSFLRSPRDANDAYNAAERALPGDTQTLLFRADLFLEKYDPGHAEEVLNEVLAKAPAQPDALVLLAHVKLAQALDFDEAERLARLALSVNPKLGAAYAILVGIALRDQDLDQAASPLH